MIKRLELAGAVVFNVHGHAFQAAGWADLQVYHKIWTGHLELKTGTELSTIQKIVMRRLKERGTHSWVLRGNEQQWIIEDENGSVERSLNAEISGINLLQELWALVVP